jgi:integrase
LLFSRLRTYINRARSFSFALLRMIFEYRVSTPPARKEIMHMKAKLTDRFIRTRKPHATRRLIVTDTVVSGLTFRINPPSPKNPDGLRYWLFRYRPRRQAQRSSVLGPYPAVSLADARQRAGDIANAAKKGIDLLAEEERQVEEQRKAAARARTVRQVGDDYLAHVKALKSYRDIRGRFYNHIFPALGHRLIGEVKQADIVELLDKIQHENGLAHMTNRVRESLICLFGYAIERQLVELNPATTTKRRKVEKPRERVLSRDELRALWRALYLIPEPGRSYVRILMLTGCRREEARAMQWTELDLEGRLWSLPSQRTKAVRPHEIPLSEAAAEIVSSLPRRGPFVFTIDGKRPMTVHQIKARLDRESGIKGWRLHDLRRTLRSSLAELGVSYEIAERVIGHAMPQLERTYNVFGGRAI